MQHPMLYIAFVLLACLGSVTADTWYFNQSIVGAGFYNAFTFKNITDPTGGRVNYVDRPTAVANNYSYATADTFILRADYNTTLNSTGPGRNSFRIQSNQKFNTHVAIYNIRHMPQGCGTWPAVWNVGTSYLTNGEIDMLEGVDDVNLDHTTLHYGSNCSMPSTGVNMTGKYTSTDCTASSGCSVANNIANSYGPAFNANGGGWYALQRTNASVQAWFWPRTGASVPPDVVAAGPTVNPAGWGTPYALFPNTSCDYTRWGAHSIMINLDFCGSYAGANSTYTASKCPGTCNTYVEQNPSAFVNAYFDFASITIYQATNGSAPTTTVTSPTMSRSITTTMTTSSRVVTTTSATSTSP